MTSLINKTADKLIKSDVAMFFMSLIVCVLGVSLTYAIYGADSTEFEQIMRVMKLGLALTLFIGVKVVSQAIFKKKS